MNSGNVVPLTLIIVLGNQVVGEHGVTYDVLCSFICNLGTVPLMSWSSQKPSIVQPCEIDCKE